MSRPSIRNLAVSLAALAGLVFLPRHAAAEGDSASPSSGEYRMEERGPEPMSCSDAIELAKYKQQISVEDGESPPNESLVPAPKECERDIVAVMQG
jgi:hypothetical protein